MQGWNTSAKNRWLHLAIAAALFAPIGIATFLSPDPRGYGTHEQLGLPPCGFRLVTGYPCPGCGGTTAFVLAVHGRFPAAFQVHVAGATSAVVCGVSGVTEVLLAAGVLKRARAHRMVALTTMLVALAAQLALWTWRTALLWLP